MKINAYKVAFLAELKDFVDTRGDLTLGEILYSILRPQGENTNNKISSILDIADDKLLKRIETAKEVEND